jgi:hypothetical protein
MKKYIQLKTVIAAKQSDRVHTGASHDAQSLCREAAKLPREHGCKKEKDADEQAEPT